VGPPYGRGPAATQPFEQAVAPVQTGHVGGHARCLPSGRRTIRGIRHQLAG
jgi:hypothetical protein